MDGIFGSLIKLFKKPREQEPICRPKKVEIKTEPDEPVILGWQMTWFAFKNVRLESITGIIGITELQPANWSSGVVAADNYPSKMVFISPPLDGWTLVSGVCLPMFSEPKRKREIGKTILKKISKECDEAQYFAMWSKIMYYAWAKARNGEIIRHVEYFDDFINQGELTPEEKEEMRRRQMKLLQIIEKNKSK